MSANVSAGTVELTSVAAGYEVLDALIKAADVVVLQARHVCSGKFFIVYSGKIADVETAMQTARKVGGEFVEDYLTVANAHPGLFPAMAQTVALPPGKLMSLGVVETKTASSALRRRRRRRESRRRRTPQNRLRNNARRKGILYYDGIRRKRRDRDRSRPRLP